MNITCVFHSVISKLKGDLLWRKLYVLFASMALLFYFFGHPQSGMEKIFYIPCGLSMLCSFFCGFKRDRMDGLLCLMVICALVAALVNRNLSFSLTSPTVRFIFGIACFNAIRKCDATRFTNLVSNLSVPLMLGFLIIEIPLLSQHRYMAYTGDPNYLAMGITLIVALNMCRISGSHNLREQCLSWAVLLICSLIVIATMSRIGLTGLILLYLFFIYYILQKRLTRYLAVLSVCAISLVVIGLFVINTGDYPLSRFAISDRTGINSITSRFSQIYGVLQYFIANPTDLLIGIGLDARAVDLPEYGLLAHHCVHNTFFQALLHLGVVGGLVFVYFLFCICKKVFLQGSYIKIGLLIAFILNMNSIPSLTSLIFWWGIFFLVGGQRETTV